MEMYVPYIPQALALVIWCACMALVTAHKIGTLASSAAMLAGSGAMALACLASGDRISAISCVAVGIWVQAIPLFGLRNIRGHARTCAMVVADGIHVVLTMSMVAGTAHNGACACTDAVRLAGVLAALTLLASALCEHVEPPSLDARGTGPLAVAAAITAYAMLRSPNCSVLVSLPWWGYASLTEATIACCAVALATSTALYDPPTDRSGWPSRVALPAAMVVEACCMSFLGDASTGIALALAMAVAARSAGRRTATIVAALAVAVLAAVGLSLVVPNMANAWRIWAGTMEPPFEGIRQADTVKALFSGDSAIFGYGVGRASQAMLDAPFGVAWPLMMMVGTFGGIGLATLAAVCVCSVTAGVRAITSRECASLPFLAVTMGATLAFGLLAILGVLPDLGNHGPMFLCLDVSACEPVFMAAAFALSIGCDAWAATNAEGDHATALLPPASEG